jgi:hypothetical protein
MWDLAASTMRRTSFAENRMIATAIATMDTDRPTRAVAISKPRHRSVGSVIPGVVKGVPNAIRIHRP